VINPENLQADEEPQFVFIVFSTNGGFCKAHTGSEAEFTSARHASAVKGFTVKVPLHDDFREYPD